MNGRVTTLGKIMRIAGIGSVPTLLDLIRRPMDPIPVWYRQGRRAWAIEERVRLWRRRENGDKTLPTVHTQREIAKVANISRPAVARYAARAWHPLPVKVTPDGEWWAYVSALQDWLDAENEPGWRVRVAHEEAEEGEGEPSWNHARHKAARDPRKDRRPLRDAASSPCAPRPIRGGFPENCPRSGGTMGAES